MAKMILLSFQEETDAGATKIEQTIVLKNGADKFDQVELVTAVHCWLSSVEGAGHVTLAAPQQVIEVPAAAPSIEGPGSSSLQ